MVAKKHVSVLNLDNMKIISKNWQVGKEKMKRILWVLMPSCFKTRVVP